MAKVIAQATMSLDGFIADENDAVGPLFDWYGNGDVDFLGADEERVFRVSRASADYLREAWANVPAGVVGRRLFDLTNGWNGRPPVGEAVFVLTHKPPADWPEKFPDAPFTFVTDSLRSAIEQAKSAADGRDVSVSAGNLLGQALDEGLVDELRVDLVPVVFGKGVRFFGEFSAAAPQLLENPTIVEGDRVTHLHYRVRKS